MARCDQEHWIGGARVIALPWNEYAIRCELKLTLENERRYLDGNFLCWSELGRCLRLKYGVTSSAYNDAWLAVGAALHPSAPKFKGIIPHEDSCIPGKDAYNREHGLGPYEGMVLSQPFVDPRGRMSSAHLFPKQLPKDPNTMSNKPIEITTRTYANGQDISALSDSEVYELIAKEEAKIEELGKIKAQPKKLVAEIEKRQAGIVALVAHLDSKEAA